MRTTEIPGGGQRGRPQRGLGHHSRLRTAALQDTYRCSDRELNPLYALNRKRNNDLGDKE